MKFTPEDFQPHSADIRACANVAQAKFDKWLSEQRVLYGTATANETAINLATAGYLPTAEATHVANVVCIRRNK